VSDFGFATVLGPNEELTGKVYKEKFFFSWEVNFGIFLKNMDTFVIT